MQLWQHPNGIFYVLHGLRLKQRVSTRTSDRKTAEVFLSQFIAAQGSIAPDSPTVGAILDAYELDRKPHVRSKQTMELAVVVLKKHLGDLQPEQISPVVMRKYVKDRGVAAGSILREVGVLRAGLSWAVENKWIKQAPIISNPVKIPPPRSRWISKDEARRLIAACVQPHVKAFVMLGVMTAARHGAILELRWDQVDFGAGRIDYGPGYGNKRRAVVPINPELARTLSAAKELACTEYVIECHGRPLKSIKNGFRLACKRAGLKGVTAHVLRHSAATWMAMDGRPMSEIARFLGDREETVERVYAKHHPDYLRQAASALQLTPEVA